MVAGVDNRNPWNVKTENRSNPWKGTLRYDPRGHVIFSNEIYSARAVTRILGRYWENDRRTLTQIFERYAPADDHDADNNPNEYAAFVAGRLGVEPDEQLRLFSGKHIDDEHQLHMLAAAMAEFENFAGYDPGASVIRSGMSYYARDFA
jgi:hypothetical protein